MALIQQSTIEQILERPPDAFHIRLVIGDISFVQVHPEADPLGHSLPLLRVAEDAFHALVDEWLDAVGLDFFLAVDAQFFADFHLDGQAVGIPAGFAFAEVAAHGAVAREQIFDGPRQAVARMRQAVGGRRAFVKDKTFGIGPACERFFIDLAVFPEVYQSAVQAPETARYYLPLQTWHALLDSI